jgi:hypothetical protein
MNPQDPQIDSGNFINWFKMTVAAIQTSADVYVPCRDCTACCKSGFYIAVGKDETQTLERIPKKLLKRLPGLQDLYYLGHDQHGHCHLLKDGLCSIYEDRPHACRTFDCRIFIATGIQLDKDPASPINGRVQEWEFRYPTQGDQVTQEYLKQVAAILQEHTKPSPDDPSSENHRLLALKAILITSRLLKRKGNQVEQQEKE